METFTGKILLVMVRSLWIHVQAQLPQIAELSSKLRGQSQDLEDVKQLLQATRQGLDIAQQQLASAQADKLSAAATHAAACSSLQAQVQLPLGLGAVFLHV